MKVACYLRVSTDMQREEGYSIDAQKNRLAHFADSQDWTLYDFYIDAGFSAKDMNRPALKKMMEDMNQFDVVLVYKLDRLTRSVLDLHKLLNEFEKYNVRFKSATEVFETTTAMGRFFITLVGAMASWERETIAERVRFGAEQMVREGQRPGGVIPFGYDSQMNIIPDEAEIIREAREIYMNGENGYKTVAMTLNIKGNLRRGKEWSAATVRYTLENPLYAGLIRYGSKNSDGKYVNWNKNDRVDVLVEEGSHESIFTRIEYEEYLKKMKRRGTSGYSKIGEYWFTGVLRCGKCGSSMHGRMTTKRARKDGSFIRTPYYICNNRNKTGSCHMPMFRQVHVEELLLAYIDNIKLDQQILKNESNLKKNEIDKKQKKLAQLKMVLNSINDRRKKWQYMFVEELISAMDLKLRMKEEDEKESSIKKEIAEMSYQLNPSEPISEQLFELSDFWNEINDNEKRDIIQTIFEEITLYTPLEKIKGIKGKSFDAEIKKVKYN